MVVYVLHNIFTTLIISISACGINSQNTHYFPSLKISEDNFFH